MEEYWFGCDDDNKYFWRRFITFCVEMSVIIAIIIWCSCGG